MNSLKLYRTGPASAYPDINADCGPQYDGRLPKARRRNLDRADRNQGPFFRTLEAHQPDACRKVRPDPFTPRPEIQEKIPNNTIVGACPLLFEKSRPACERLGRSECQAVPVPDVVALKAHIVIQGPPPEDVEGKPVHGIVQRDSRAVRRRDGSSICRQGGDANDHTKVTLPPLRREPARIEVNGHTDQGPDDESLHIESLRRPFHPGWGRPARRIHRTR